MSSALAGKGLDKGVGDVVGGGSDDGRGAGGGGGGGGARGSHLAYDTEMVGKGGTRTTEQARPVRRLGGGVGEPRQYRY